MTMQLRYALRYAFTLVLCLLPGCSFFHTLSTNPRQTTLRQWGAQVKNFSPERPTILFAFDLKSCISCNAGAITAMSDRIQQHRLNANLLIVITVDQAGEAKAITTESLHPLIAEDTADALRHVFGIKAFPSLLIVDPNGRILHQTIDPVHNFPPDHILLRYLSPLSSTIDSLSPLRYAHSSDLLITVSESHPSPYGNKTLLIDDRQQALCLLDIENQTISTLWKATDSLRFRPEYAAILRTLPDSIVPASTDWWQMLQQRLPMPLATIKQFAAVTDSTIILYGHLLLPIVRGNRFGAGLSGALFHLQWDTSNGNKATLFKLTFLDTLIGDKRRFFTYRDTLHLLASSVDSLAFYQYTSPAHLRWIGSLSFDSSLPAPIRNRAICPAKIAFTGHSHALLFNAKLPHLVLLSFDSSLQARYSVIRHFPYTGKLYRQRLQRFRYFLNNFRKLLAILHSLNKPNTPIGIDDPVQLLKPLNDTLWTIAIPADNHLTLQLYSPSGFVHEYQYHVDLNPSDIQLATAVQSHNIYLLIKHRSRGWVLCHVPLPYIVTNS